MAKRSCKFGKVSRGPRKGHCRKAKKSSSGGSKKLHGAAARAKACKGQKGSAFKSCVRGGVYGSSDTSKMYGLGGLRRRRKSRR